MLEAGLWTLVSAERMHALDAWTIERIGVPSEVLMESAGRAVVDHLIASLCERIGPSGREGAIAVVCGGGHNGGDGLVVARHLHGLGWPVCVHLVADRARLGDTVGAQLARAEQMGVPVCDVPDGCIDVSAASILVDALFGTGLGRPVEGAAAESVRRIVQARACGAAVVSIDLPSGIDADTGAVLGTAVTADETVTISLPKLGLAIGPGRAHAGHVVVARIGIVDALPDDDASGRAGTAVWTRGGIADALPARPTDGHKGHFGHVLVAAGSEGKTGAAALAARAAIRSGAGLVTVACADGLNDILEVKCTEAMTAPVGDPGARRLGRSALEALLALAAERDVLALGPGLGTDEETCATVRTLCERVEIPMVLDADGLNAIGRDVGVLKGRRSPTVLTPHPGEAARLLGRPAAEINADRVGAAAELAAQTGCVVVLKGAGTVVADAAGPVRVNPTGNAALGSGGTGDVLTGMIAALWAQGLSGPDAASVGVYLHGAAADAWAESRGESGLVAEELADTIPETARRLRRREPVGTRARMIEERGGRADRERTLLCFPFGR